MPEATRVIIRGAEPADAANAAKIGREAFLVEAGLPVEDPDLDLPWDMAGAMREMMRNPSYAVSVAEHDGTLVGAYAIDERSPVTGLGPIMIEPHRQGLRVGERLFQELLPRVIQRDSGSARAMVIADNGPSMALLLRAGGVLREPVLRMGGTPPRRGVPGTVSRQATADDLPRCREMCRTSYGFERHGEIVDALGRGTLRVVERRGNVTGYTADDVLPGHTVAEDVDSLKALIDSTPASGPVEVRLPSQAQAIRDWLEECGFTVHWPPFILVALGPYQPPSGYWMPSVNY